MQAPAKRKHENRLTIKVSCFVSSLIKQFPLPTQFRPSPITQYMLHSNYIHNCNSKPRIQLPDASEKSKPTFPNRTVSTCHPSLSPLSTNNLNTKFHRAFSAMTVPTFFSLSLSTPVPKLPGKHQTASGFSFKVTSAKVRQAPLFLHTTEPQVFNYSRLISRPTPNFLSHTCGNPIHLMNQGH